MTQPAQKPGRSKQDYQTPEAFLRATRRLLGIADFDADLAANTYNAVVSRYYTITDNALVQPWALGVWWNWLNPPFGRLAPWVEKAYTEWRDHGARTAMLVPAGVGANWWRDWVHGKAAVRFLNGRLTFVGESGPYPKDCALLLYGAQPDYAIWTWPRDVVEEAVA